MQKRLGLQRLIFSIIILFSLSTLKAEPVYRIIAENYAITGRTRQNVIENILGSSVGTEFDSQEAVSLFAADRKRKLDNLRAFKDSSVTILYEEETDGLIPVSLKVSITDGSAFLPFPFAFYNSNQGFLCGAMANVPNVSGTLQNLLFMGLYSAPPNEDNKLQWAEPNFLLVGNWSNIRLNPLLFTLSGSVMRMNRQIEYLGKSQNKFLALILSGRIGAELPITDILSAKTSVRYSYSPKHTIEYVRDESLLPYGPIDSTVGTNLGFTVKSLNWEGNFRRGYKIDVTGGIETTYPSFASQQTSVDGEAEVSVYYLASSRFNPQARLSFFGKSHLPQLDSGFRVRGIRNGELRGNAGVYLNTGLQIQLLKFSSMEIHFTPCFDAVFLYTHNTSTRPYDLGLAAGGELLVFLNSLKSLPMKLGVGFDLRPEDKNGSGNFYEIDFSFNLTF